MTRPVIALVVPSLSGGGVPRVMIHLAGGLAAMGRFDVQLVSLRDRPPSYRIPHDVTVFRLGASRLTAGIPRVVRYLREQKPLAVLTAVDTTNLVVIVARIVSRVPCRLVVSVHTNISQGYQRWRPQDPKRLLIVPRLIRCLYPRADGIVAISTAVAADLSDVTGVPLSRIQVIGNPVIANGFPVIDRGPVGHPWFDDGRVPVVLGAGRLTRAKDFETLMKAVAILRARRDVRLVVIGEGEDRAVLEELRSRLALDDVVDLPGRVANPYAYMGRASVFVLSSQWEGFGNVLVEAMAVGTPVVACQGGGAPEEILASGRYGRVVPSGNPAALALAIEQALSDPGDLDAARQRALEFTVARIAPRYLEVLVP